VGPNLAVRLPLGRRARGAGRERDGAGEHSLARRIFAGTGIIMLASGLVRAFSVVASPVLTRLLGPPAYGSASLVGTLVAFIGTVALLGIDMSYSRYYYGGVSAEPGAVERLCWRFALGSVSVLASVGALAWVYVLAPRAGASPSLGVFVGIGGLLTVTGTMAEARMRLRGRYLRLSAAIVLSGVAATLASIGLALWWRRDAWPLLIGTAVGSLVAAGISGVPSPRELLRPSGLTREQRRMVIGLGLPGAGTALMYWVLSSADRWVIAAYLPQSTLGTYAFAANLGMMGLMLNGAIMMVWFPEASRTYEADRAAAPALLGRLWSRMVALLALVWLAVAMGGGDMLRLLADPRFHSGAVYVPWVAGSVFFYGVAALAATGLVLNNDMRPVALWWIAGIAVSAALNLTLVPRVGAVAAAAAMCSAFAVIAVGVMWTAERWLPLRIEWRVLLPVLGGIAAAGVLGAPAWLASPAASLAAKLPVGAAAVALVVRLVAPDWFARGTAAAGALLARKG
jgi:O-antigen/teichoic acid export membrane protein